MSTETESKGFKLFELLFIAAAIGSVSIVAVPPLTQASSEDNIIHTMAMLHQVRSQIDLYKAQHKGALPPADTPEAFEKAMTQKGSDGFGPYMEHLPVNPFNRLCTVRVAPDANQGAGTHGWRYNCATGGFYADDSKCNAQL